MRRCAAERAIPVQRPDIPPRPFALLTGIGAFAARRRNCRWSEFGRSGDAAADLGRHRHRIRYRSTRAGDLAAAPRRCGHHAMREARKGLAPRGGGRRRSPVPNRGSRRFGARTERQLARNSGSTRVVPGFIGRSIATKGWTSKGCRDSGSVPNVILLLLAAGRS